MKWHDRLHAARLLARRLDHFRWQSPLVVGMPRAGVLMARTIADRLDADLDVALVEKLRAPEPELVIGAVDELGHVYLTDLARELGLGAEYLDLEAHIQRLALQERRRQYTPRRGPLDPAGRLVVVVDDVVTTESLTTVAIRSLRQRQAAHIVVAACVVPPDTIEHLEQEADEVVSLTAPSPLDAIDSWFDDFPRVNDTEVIDALRESPARAAAGPTSS